VQDIASFISTIEQKAATPDNTAGTDTSTNASSETQEASDVAATILSYLDV
jgi:hypothetical protein